MTATEINARLTRLRLERLEAEAAGLTRSEAYMADLDDEIAECREKLVAQAVTEIAVLRGELFGRQNG
jgi:hypothetical protein